VSRKPAEIDLIPATTPEKELFMLYFTVNLYTIIGPIGTRYS